MTGGSATLSAAQFSRPWRRDGPPSSILAIRMQALGDVVITLPYLRALQRLVPDTAIDFVTRDEDEELPRAIQLFRFVDSLGGGRNERAQLLRTPRLVARLLTRRYDVVLDLQNNRVSRVLRRALAPRAWAAFDRESLQNAGNRTRHTIEAAGFRLGIVEAALPLADAALGLDVLRRAGWDPSRALVVLSPAGAFASRHWPIDRYARFAELWRQRGPVQFVVLGRHPLRDRTQALTEAMAGHLLDLVGKTTPSQALAIVQRASLVLTEDCGLMHMAWVSGTPTLALFGSSRHIWSAPLGDHTLCLHSGDLECGACMEETCRYGDVRCLTRYSAEFVVEQAAFLLTRAAAYPTKLI